MSENLWAMSIQFFLPEDDDAVIWRGPRKYSAIREMLAGVDWGISTASWSMPLPAPATKRWPWSNCWARAPAPWSSPRRSASP